jgi:polysaccharide chain length determinant protein (PEP-CTERM system associated)
MGADFRQRTPGEYVKMLWRRKWWIILPTIAVAISIAWVVLRLPNVYESSTQLLIKPPTIAGTDIKPLREEDLALRLNNITQVIQSRASLDSLITKYNLYQDERESGKAMDLIIDKMKKNITVEIGKTGETVDTKLPSFKITYRGYDPTSTRDVVATLASMYIDEQTKSISQDAEQAKRFYDEQLDKARKGLEDVQDRRLEYMKTNSSRLPTTAASLIAQLDGLRRHQQSLTDAIARLRESRQRVQSQMTDYQLISSIESKEAADTRVDAQDAAAYTQLLSKKAQLEGEYDNLRRILTDKNPEVLAKKNEIEAINRSLLELDEKRKRRAQEVQGRAENKANIRFDSLRREVESVDREINRQQSALNQTYKSIADVEVKLNSVPEAQVAIESFDQEMKSAQLLYTQMLEQKNKIELAYKAQIEQKGALVQVVDPASLPTTPVAPKRLILIAMGLGLGLAVGLLLAGLFELPRLLTIQNVDDAAHYTKLPVLASIPEVLTPYEARWKPRRHLLGLAIGIIATIISIPILTTILTMTRVFEKFVA